MPDKKITQIAIRFNLFKIKQYMQDYEVFKQLIWSSWSTNGQRILGFNNKANG